MKIINTYLCSITKQNGPDSFEELCEVIELDNGSVYEVGNSRKTYKKMDRQKFLQLLEKSKDL